MLMNNYRLQKNDYLKLWFWLTPEEIKKEFGYRAHSPRHIRRLYESDALSLITKAKQEIIDEVDNKERLNQPEREIELPQEIEDKREMIVSQLWTRIKESEQSWDSI